MITRLEVRGYGRGIRRWGNLEVGPGHHVIPRLRARVDVDGNPETCRSKRAFSPEARRGLDKAPSGNCAYLHFTTETIPTNNAPTVIKGVDN